MRTKVTKYVASFSGGKDSTAMMFHLLDNAFPLDYVVFGDVGFEFPEIYANIDKMNRYLIERGFERGVTRIADEHSFEWHMLERPITNEKRIKSREKRSIPLTGLGWPKMFIRWCTSEMKVGLFSKVLRATIREEIGDEKAKVELIQYVGIAADETKRLKVKNNVIYPLADAGITESDALETCKKRGFDFGGLYDFQTRCSCWHCPLQRIAELKWLYCNRPELWAKLREMDERAIAHFGADSPFGQYRQGKHVRDYEERFKREIEREKNNGVL